MAINLRRDGLVQTKGSGRKIKSRRLSENRKPTAEKPQGQISRSQRYTNKLFRSYDQKTGLKITFPRYGSYSRTAS